MGDPKVLEPLSARIGASVRAVPVAEPTDPGSGEKTVLCGGCRSRTNLRPPHDSAKACHHNRWRTALLIVASCGALLALSGCGATFLTGADSGTLKASPSSIAFGAVSFGQTASATVSLSNGGAAPVVITQLNLTGQSFSVATPSDLPVAIAAGGTYGLKVQFNPAASGTATGQLVVASNGSKDPAAVISLSGTGMSAPPTLSALSCSSGSMTGSGTDACTVTLAGAAPSGGLVVNLTSSSSAVTVPGTVTVPAGAASTQFTATVSSVTTAQAATMAASVGGMVTSFNLQLNAAILALSINATSIPFGDVVVDTSSTQAVKATSTGTVPVTISGAKLTGSGFTLSGAALPALLTPGQEATLYVEFDPTAVGAANGQLTIDSNSSTNGTAVISLTGTGTAPQILNLPIVQAKPADGFVNSVGLNVHFSYYGSVYTTQSSQLIQRIAQLGVRHLRDQMAWEGTSVSDSPFYTIHNTLGSNGVKTDYILTSINYPMGQVGIYPTLVNDMEAAEATNEYDGSGDPNWVENITSQQRALYAEIQSQPITQNIVVLAPSLSYPKDASKLGNLDSISAVGNSHAYFGGYNPGNSGTGGANDPPFFINQALADTPGESIWITETGFWSVPGPYWGGYGVSEAAQATYTPRVLLEFSNAGAARTYIYALADYTSNDLFGLLRSDGTAKPAFGSLANLLTLLSDPGPAFTPTQLGYSLSGAGPNVHQALFQKRDGSFFLALWVEALSYNFLTSQPISVPAQQVSLNLGRAVLAATSFQFDDAGNMTTTSLPPSQTLVLTVTDKVQIVKLVLQ